MASVRLVLDGLTFFMLCVSEMTPHILILGGSQRMA